MSHPIAAAFPPATVARLAAVEEGLARQAQSRDPSLAQWTREDRRRLVHALTALELAVVDSRGYNYAEVTAGGVALDEIDPATMESRKVRNLFLVGEMLDVDGRLGGFNFQWAWASGKTAARGATRLR